PRVGGAVGSFGRGNGFGGGGADVGSPGNRPSGGVNVIVGSGAKGIDSRSVASGDVVGTPPLSLPTCVVGFTRGASPINPRSVRRKAFRSNPIGGDAPPSSGDGAALPNTCGSRSCRI